MSVFTKRLQEKLLMTSKMGLDEVEAADIYRALGLIIQEEIGEDWTLTHLKQQEQDSKRMYYLSMEYLTGKFLEKNLLYRNLLEDATFAVSELGFDIKDVLAVEPEPGLGNGGLGRLAVEFLDSLASLGYPGHGYGLRYEKGLFKQLIQDGRQMETADDWINDSDTLQYKREDAIYEVKLGGYVETLNNDGVLTFKHVGYDSLKAEAYDIPMLGYRNGVVNNLRLWKASSFNDVNLAEFSKGNYNGAFKDRNRASALVQFLYPSDSYYEGKKLRLEQEYFLVSASIQDIMRKFVKKNVPMKDLSDHIAIHINDTHPVLAIPELMRILMDDHLIDWEEAWSITSNVFAFTNHTILSEAMETWDVDLFRSVLPRIFQITEEINRKFMMYLRETRHINDNDQLNKLNLIWDNKVRMVNLAIVGSHSVNGVAKLHSQILMESELNHFYRIYPDKFNNKTNGIVHRIWLLAANKELTNYLKGLIGEDFTFDARRLDDLMSYKDDEKVYKALFDIKREKKVELAKIILDRQGIVINPDSIFDVHIKRIHEYKRQLLNALHIIYLYDQLKENPNLDMVPRTFIFAGKAAPGYQTAKEIIRLINSLANLINNDLTIKDKIKVVFIPNYSISSAMEIIPAADVSEQISTTTKEASGTGNMKFMMNGAVTLATLDGANVEISEAVNEDNIVIFGMKAHEVYEYYANNEYNSREIYNSHPDIKRTIDRLIDRDYFVDHETFGSLHEDLINYNDNYFLLQDFESYKEAQQKIERLYRDRSSWMRMSLINTARSGELSADNTIRKYAEEIWKIKIVK